MNDTEQAAGAGLLPGRSMVLPNYRAAIEKNKFALRISP